MSVLQCGELGGYLALEVWEGSQYKNIWQDFCYCDYDDDGDDDGCERRGGVK